MTALTCHELAQVIGAQASESDDSTGRCGPGFAWRLLRDVRTKACKQHDLAVQNALDHGYSYLGAQWQARDKLLPAVKSYVDAVL